jgi:sterol desaturase/sphingolipid hydroxylase (fatty acid hydroxylase superfamily)
MTGTDQLLIALQGIRTPIAFGWLAALLAWESVWPFFDFFRNRVGHRVAHGWRNLAIGLINATVVSLGFVALWALAAQASQRHGIGVLHLLNLDGWWHAACALFILDAWTYAWHRMNHRIPFFWRFHKVHHSDSEMDVTTATRFHGGEIVLSSILRLPVIFLAGIELWELVLFETAMFVVVQFHHANIGLPPRLDQALRLFIVTPAMHKVHHSRFQPETDSNYTALLSVWDRLFGTFRINPRPESIRFGLEGLDQERHQNFRGLLSTPFGKRRSESDSPLPPHAR